MGQEINVWGNTQDVKLVLEETLQSFQIDLSSKIPA